MGIPGVQDTVADLLRFGDENSAAIASTDGSELSFGQLRAQIQNAHLNFRHLGFKTTDVVATSLVNSPETAITLLSLMTYCGVAPLNPSYTQHEVKFALTDIGANALVAAPTQVNAIAAANESGVSIVSPAIACGTERFGSEPMVPEALGEANLRPDDLALLLHTSGTTSRPKLVALKHRNLVLSSRAVAQVLNLSTNDRCLSVMPMFHIHGLVAGLLASIAAGACTACASPFQATSFFEWLEKSRATWYTAVPTMHQAILTRSRHNARVLSQQRLRVIRSSSAPLFPTVWQQLEDVFGAPVVNSYGMTEAAHQIASVSLGRARMVRSGVGQSSGPEIAIMDPNGRILPPGERGEVVLRGEQIINGYLKPAEANGTSFAHGWLRTGDEGWLDSEQALTLTGRLKEMINSGGEKISPYEVEDALLIHPAVSQAIAFSAPHNLLGEQVMAAVVLHEGSHAVERDLLQAASSRLAHCKLPRADCVRGRNSAWSNREGTANGHVRSIGPCRCALEFGATPQNSGSWWMIGFDALLFITGYIVRLAPLRGNESLERSFLVAPRTADCSNFAAWSSSAEELIGAIGLEP